MAGRHMLNGRSYFLLNRSIISIIAGKHTYGCPPRIYGAVATIPYYLGGCSGGNNRNIHRHAHVFPPSIIITANIVLKEIM